MKKILTTVLVLVNLISFAQIRPLSQYGFKVGTGISQSVILNNPTDIRSKFRNDFNVGVFHRWNIKKISVQPEAYFQIRGGSFKSSTTNFTETNNLVLRNKYQYVSIPLILGYEIAKNVHLIAGPEYGFAVNAGTKAGPYAQTDLNLVGGIRIDMLDAAHLFSLNIRYEHGLSNTTNKTFTKADKTVVPLDFRNRTLQISATYNFSDYYRWYKKHGTKKKN
jgi:Outer membrane protein beta-barrel domain